MDVVVGGGCGWDVAARCARRPVGDRDGSPAQARLVGYGDGSPAHDGRSVTAVGRGTGVTVRTAALVAAGGAIGGPARYAVESMLSAPSDGVPWGTLVVNVSGALALGVLLGSGRARAGVAAAVGTGFLGAFTTFSGWVLQVALLAQHGRPTAAAGYVAVTLVAGLGAAAAGCEAGRRLAGTGRRR